MDKLLIVVEPNEYPIFPQANDIYRIISFVDSLIENKFNNIDFLKPSITERQIHYYKTAAEYLRLLNGFEPSQIALKIFKKNQNEIFIEISKLILSNRIFLDYFNNRDKQKTINALIDKYSLSEVTAKRRFSTIIAWVKWCTTIIQDNNLVIEYF